MSPTDATEPEIPDDAMAIWEELTERAIPARRRAVAARDAAQGDVDRESANCRRLVIEALQRGVRRQNLVGMPFSEGWLSRIQREAGLTRKQRAARHGEARTI